MRERPKVAIAAAIRRGFLSRITPFMPHLWAQRRRLALAYTLTLLGVVLNMALPWPLKFLIDEVLTGNRSTGLLNGLTGPSAVLAVAGSMAVLALLAAVTLSNEKVLHARVREQFTLSLRDRLIRHIYGLSLLSRQAEHSGELALRLGGDSQLVARLLCKTVPFAIRDLTVALTLLGAIFWIDVRIGAIATLTALVLAVIVAHYGPKVTRASTVKRRREGEVAALAQQSIAGIEHVQAMALEKRIRSRYLRESQGSLGAGVDEVRVAVEMERAAQIFSGVAIALVAGVGGLMVLAGELSLGTLTVCIAYINQLLKPIEKLNEIASDTSRGLVRAQRLIDLLGAKPAIIDRSGHELVGPLTEIACEHVSYGYPGAGEAAIVDFSHVFRKGECTAIVGPSGAGKSTLLRLLLRLIEPSSGAIYANRQAYGGLRPDSLRSQFAVLMQSAHLFSGTIRDIVTELEPDADDQTILDALADVGLRSLVEGLPDGLDTRIDETGARLSGGQRTRLLLARATVCDRPLLVLDEPFANIDDVSKRVILDALRRMKTEHVMIVVTHDRLLLEIADHVLTPSDWRARASERIAHA